MPVSKIEGKQRLIYNNACFEHRANYKMSEEKKLRTVVSDHLPYCFHSVSSSDLFSLATEFHSPSKMSAKWFCHCCMHYIIQAV